MKTEEVRIYTCPKHPKWKLETAAPETVGGLAVLCPQCREAFIIANIGLPHVRVEVREIEEVKT